MTLRKGFLISHPKLYKPHLILGLTFWICWTFLFHLAFEFMFEFFIVLTGKMGDAAMIILNKDEAFTYSLFYASMSCAIAYNFSLDICLKLTSSCGDKISSRLIRRTINDLNLYTWNALSWFARASFLFAILCITFAMQYEIDFLKEFYLFLILLPLSIFYSSWPKLSRWLRLGKFKLFGAITILFVSISAAFSFFTVFDGAPLKSIYLSNSIQNVYGLRYAETESGSLINEQGEIIDLYLVLDTAGYEKPILFKDSISNRIKLGEIWKVDFEDPDAIYRNWQEKKLFNLHIDDRVKMKYVRGVFHELSQIEDSKVYLSTVARGSAYPVDYPGYKYWGIRKLVVAKYDPNGSVDSIKRELPISQTLIRDAELWEYVLGNPTLEIRISKRNIYVDGQVIRLEQLAEVSGSFMYRNASNYAVLIDSDEDVLFHYYIKVLDVINMRLNGLRNIESSLRYGFGFNDRRLSYEAEMNIKSRYPAAFLDK